MRLKGLVLLAIVPVLVGTVLPVSAQTLADLAKKEEERRKKIPEPAKVYTNKDLLPAPTSSTPPPAAGSSATTPSSTPAASATTPTPGDAGAPKEEVKGPAKDRAYWAGRMKTLNENLSRDEIYAESMQTRLNSLQTDFVNRDDPIQRAGIERDRQNVSAELTRLKKSIADTKKAIADLEEEARRAGVPPGWLR
jgi:hypothetical protein